MGQKARPSGCSASRHGRFQAQHHIAPNSRKSKVRAQTAWSFPLGVFERKLMLLEDVLPVVEVPVNGRNASNDKEFDRLASSGIEG